MSREKEPRTGQGAAQGPEQTLSGDRPVEAALTIGVDGRIYCHDLPPELLPVLAEICPADPVLTVREGLLAEKERSHG